MVGGANAITKFQLNFSTVDFASQVTIFNQCLLFQNKILTLL